MANNVVKVNSIAIASIAKINGQNDADLAKLNGEEFTGGFPGLTWSTSTVANTTFFGGLQIGTSSAGGIIIGDKVTLNEWNGSSWSTDGAMSIPKGAGDAGGPLTAGVAYAGYNTNSSAISDVTEEYNGSSWSTGNDMVSGTNGPSGGGNVQTNQISTGGSTYGPTVRDIASTELYDGTSWSNASEDSTGQNGTQSVGTTNWVKPAGSYDAAGIQVTSQFFTLSSTTWSSIANVSNATRYNKCWGDETQTFTCGGYEKDDYGAPVYYSFGEFCEMWVDDTWSTQASLPIDIGGHGHGGSNGGSAVAGGWTTGGDSGQGNSITHRNHHYIAVAV